MKQFFKRLNEPFPDSDPPKENFRNTVLIGMFITFFLYIFESDGMEGYPGNKFLLCLNFGLITIGVSLLFDSIATYVLKIDRSHPSWTLLRWIIYIFLLLIFISIGNYIYFIKVSAGTPVSIKGFLLIAVYTMTIGMFPVIFSGMMIQMRANKRNQIQAANFQSHLPKSPTPDQSIQIISTQKNQNFEAQINDIFYLEAMQNYVSIHYLKDGKLKKELLRNTIKDIETQLENTSLIRCHRSFIVNSNLINNVAGNAQGLRLQLKNLENHEVPVSRKYIPILKEIIA